MDPALSTVIVALITGIISVIVVIIQKRQDKVIKKIDQQTMFIEKEKGIRQQLADKEKDRTIIIDNIIMMILDTNLAILKDNDTVNATILETARELKSQLDKISDEIKDLEKQYKVVLDMTAEFQKSDKKK